MSKWAGPDYRGRWAIFIFLLFIIYIYILLHWAIFIFIFTFWFMINNDVKNNHFNYHYDDHHQLALSKWAGPDYKGRWALFIFMYLFIKVYIQGCTFRLTCSHPELTEDHVLTSAYVKFFRIVTRNAVNEIVWRKKDCSWLPEQKRRALFCKKRITGLWESERT